MKLVELDMTIFPILIEICRRRLKNEYKRPDFFVYGFLDMRPRKVATTLCLLRGIGPNYLM